MSITVRWSDEDDVYVATVMGTPQLSWIAATREDAAIGLCRVLAEEIARLRALRSEDHATFAQQYRELEASRDAMGNAVTELTRRVVKAEPEVGRLKAQLAQSTKGGALSSSQVEAILNAEEAAYWSAAADWERRRREVKNGG
jgi:uncharacterized small protein (DUF1192 family)